MKEMGVREFGQRVSEVLRRVREEGESCANTYRGRVVARVVPAGPGADAGAVWAELDELAREIGVTY